MGRYLAVLAPLSPRLPDERSEARSAALARFEGELGAALPEPCRSFLAECAGVFLHDVVAPAAEGGEVCVETFHGLDVLAARQRTYRDRLPPEALPIAEDPGGNQLFFVLAGPDAGRVMLWHHDRPRTSFPAWWWERVERALESEAARETLAGVELTARDAEERRRLRWEAAKDALPWWEYIHRVADDLDAFVASLRRPEAEAHDFSRVGMIQRAVEAGASLEWTTLGPRPAVRVVRADGARQISVLDEAERQRLEGWLRDR